MSPPNLRIGTRQSRLALAQTRIIVDLLCDLDLEIDVEIVKLSSLGDERPDDSIVAGLGVGAFTNQIQNALLDEAIDVAVHSLKDLPVQGVTGIELAAVPVRDDPSDVLVSRAGIALEDLPAGARVGTSSPRRAAQIKLVREDLSVGPLRGNVETRIRKVDDCEIDAAILAAAGLIRLGLSDRIVQHLAMPAFLPAPGQGALAIETREGDSRAANIIRGFDDPGLRACITAEREFLSALGGGCLQPVGALGIIRNQKLELRAGAYGEVARTVVVSGSPNSAPDIGKEAADLVLAGAGI